MTEQLVSSRQALIQARLSGALGAPAAAPQDILSGVYSPTYTLPSPIMSTPHQLTPAERVAGVLQQLASKANRPSLL